MNDPTDRSWFVIVDPEPAGLRLADGLRIRKCRVDVFCSMKELLSMLQAQPEKPAVALVELHSSGGLSLNFIQTLRDKSQFTRIIVVTAYGSVASAVQAMRLGVENYLCKPVSADLVLHCLRDMSPVGLTSPLVHPSLDRAIWEYIHFVLTEERTIAGAARRLRVQPRSLRRMLQKFPPPN